MKTILKLMTGIAIILPVLCSCSGNAKNASGNEATESTNTMEAKTPASLDFERINTFKKMKITDYTSADFDFMLDQLEIIAEMVQGKQKKEWQEYLKGLNTDQKSAYEIVALSTMMAAGEGRFSEQQMKRYKALEQQNPFGK